MKSISDNDLMTNIRQLVPSLLKDHVYGIYDLAQACSQQLHQPICEIMTPFSNSLREMVNCGELRYDRQHNQVLLG